MKMRLLLAILLVGFGAPTIAQSPGFVFAANELLAVEMPKMEAAVSARDRAYFGPALERVQNLLNQHRAELDSSPACTNAVTDFLIVGLCRIPSRDPICVPETFIPKFEKNLALCRVAVPITKTSLNTR